MPATKRGVFHNLKESEYTISNSEIVFFFSSKVYRRKFMEGYREHRKIFANKISNIAVGIPHNLDVMADITFYKIIEKRGFHAWVKGVTVTWQDLHQYALAKMTVKNTNDWCVIQKPKSDERRRIMELT